MYFVYLVTNYMSSYDRVHFLICVGCMLGSEKDLILRLMRILIFVS